MLETLPLTSDTADLGSSFCKRGITKRMVVEIWVCSCLSVPGYGSETSKGRDSPRGGLARAQDPECFRYSWQPLCNSRNLRFISHRNSLQCQKRTKRNTAEGTSKKDGPEFVTEVCPSVIPPLGFAHGQNGLQTTSGSLSMGRGGEVQRFPFTSMATS